MHHHVNPVHRNIEKPTRLDDLETLVHHRRGINRHLRTHLPARMIERLLDGHLRKVFGSVQKRTATRRQNQPVYISNISIRTLAFFTFTFYFP